MLTIRRIWQRFKPPMVIGISMVIWGICCVCIGLVQNAAGLTGTRFLLGIFEGMSTLMEEPRDFH
jgi:MFS family permease